MYGQAPEIPRPRPVVSGGFSGRQSKITESAPALYPWYAWPANDNKPLVWRGMLGWALVGMGIGCFAFVAVTLLL